MERNFNLEELNQQFSIDRYLACSESDRVDFRFQLLACMKKLRSKVDVIVMHHKYALEIGIWRKNKTAIAISILEGKLDERYYDELFYFHDTIRLLRRMLLYELFGGKNIFYDLGNDVVAYDPNYVPYILGNEMKRLPRSKKIRKK